MTQWQTGDKIVPRNERMMGTVRSDDGSELALVSVRLPDGHEVDADVLKSEWRLVEPRLGRSVAPPNEQLAIQARARADSEMRLFHDVAQALNVHPSMASWGEMIHDIKKMREGRHDNGASTIRAMHAELRVALGVEEYASVRWEDLIEQVTKTREKAAEK